MWVLVSLTGKVFDSWIRDLGFNPRLHQKLISVLVRWWRTIIRSGRHRLKLSLKKKKNSPYIINPPTLYIFISWREKYFLYFRSFLLLWKIKAVQYIHQYVVGFGWIIYVVAVLELGTKEGIWQKWVFAPSAQKM